MHGFLLAACMMVHAPNAVAVCGDAVLEPAEECDSGLANGAPESCCDLDCAFSDAARVCRTAAGECDRAETCSGTEPECPADVLQPLGMICRAPSNACDLGSLCDGVGPVCPPTPPAPEGLICVDDDGCTVNDRCANGVCESGLRVCDVTGRITRRAVEVRCSLSSPGRGSCGFSCEGIEGRCFTSKERVRRFQRGQQTVVLKLRFNKFGRRLVAQGLTLSVGVRIETDFGIFSKLLTLSSTPRM
jgi:hypothetical protein